MFILLIPIKLPLPSTPKMLIIFKKSMAINAGTKGTTAYFAFILFSILVY